MQTTSEFESTAQVFNVSPLKSKKELAVEAPKPVLMTTFSGEMGETFMVGDRKKHIEEDKQAECQETKINWTSNQDFKLESQKIQTESTSAETKEESESVGQSPTFRFKR